MVALLLASLLASSAAGVEAPAALEAAILAEDPAALARAAREGGDARRGAVLFHQPAMACARCHQGGEGRVPMGRNAAGAAEPLSDAQVIESVLKPSQVIKKGYETVTLLTESGAVMTGLVLEERAEGLLFCDPTRDFKPVALSRESVKERSTSPVSLMPAGLVNQLATRQQFLDLASYCLEVVEKGPARERELRPDPSLLVPPPLPEYEKDIDHAGMIAGLDDGCFRRGEAIYVRVCANCHGTRDHPGSLPSSLPFASGQFKNGSDPYGMYQTLTRGFGTMAPQTWMVPRQKYDVIHYVREAYLRGVNPSQYAPSDDAYRMRLPQGKSRGPEPSLIEPWVLMNRGPSFMATYEVGSDGSNFAYKGIAVRLDDGPGGVSRGRHWMLYDHDTLRAAAAWTGDGFIDWNGINFNGRHEVHPRIAGRIQFANPTGPGWAGPDGNFDDVRLRGRDGRPYGPLPRSWARYRGVYHFENRVILSYTVGAAEVLEMPGLAAPSSSRAFTRTFNIGPRDRELVLETAHRAKSKPGPRSPGAGGESRWQFAVLESGDPSEPDRGPILAGVSSLVDGESWAATDGGRLQLRIPAGEKPLKFTLWVAHLDEGASIEAFASAVRIDEPERDLIPLTRGGLARWPEKLSARAALGDDRAPFAADVLTHPEQNPWACQMRFTGLDFLPGGSKAVLSTWDGDVWLVEGIDQPGQGLQWQRIASGLFQPLGVKVVDGQIHVGCRDQIVILRDLNGDGETDFYACFNNDHQVTEHFHEFAMGLETDAAGNFYYAKGARHAKTALVPHHGTLLRVLKDGSRTDVLATGFRAPNGVCINPDGTFLLTDQEGHWMPKNRINWVTEGSFNGNMWGYHDVTDPSDGTMEPPLCWITNSFDRSPAEILRVEGQAWEPLKGSLLSLSYGYGKIFIVLHEKIRGRIQGGVTPLPMKRFPTGVMRGRFHPGNGHLHACGMFAWAGDQQEPGGFFRVRLTGKPFWLPLRLEARKEGLEITFSGKLDPISASDPGNYAIKTWSLKRTANYGSGHLNERSSRIESATVSADGVSVFLQIPGIAPTHCMEIKYFLRGSGGEPVEGVIHNTIHELSG